MQLCRNIYFHIVNMRFGKIFNARLSFDLHCKSINQYVSTMYFSFYELAYLEKVFIHLKLCDKT